MSLHHFLLITHLICATIWVGGHLFLLIRVLSQSVRTKDIDKIKRFKSSYEPVGMPALILLMITGIWMAYNYTVDWSKWFSFSTPVERVISIKLLLLIATFILAQIADRIIFPKLHKRNMFMASAFIFTVTLISVAMLVLGSFIRYGGLLLKS